MLVQGGFDTVQHFIHAGKLRSTSGHLSRLGLPVLGIDFKFGVELCQFPVNGNTCHNGHITVLFYLVPLQEEQYSEC